MMIITRIFGKIELLHACMFTVLGCPRVLQSRFILPLALVCVPTSPAKSTKFKITVDTNQPPVDLSSIFQGKSTLSHPGALN